MSILRTVLHKLIYICYSRDTISLSRSNNYMINILKEGFYEGKISISVMISVLMLSVMVVFAGSSHTSGTLYDNRFGEKRADVWLEGGTTSFRTGCAYIIGSGFAVDVHEVVYAGPGNPTVIRGSEWSFGIDGYSNYVACTAANWKNCTVRLRIEDYLVLHSFDMYINK